MLPELPSVVADVGAAASPEFSELGELGLQAASVSNATPENIAFLHIIDKSPR